MHLATRMRLVASNKTISVLALLGCLPVMPGASPIWGADESTAQTVGRAEEALSQLHDQGFEGSVLVACGDQPLLHRTYGVKLRPDETPSYWVASITKQFTAAAVLKLIDESDLTLQSRLVDIFEKVPADKIDITIHQLLSHQSGLPQAYASAGVSNRDEALAAILGLELEREPGSGFGYSNDGYTLLAIIIEEVSGSRYEAYMKRLVVDPADLRQAAFWPQLAGEGEVIPPLVSPLSADDYVENWDLRGPTGMRLSVEDLHRWVLALERLEVLNEAQRRQLLGPHVRTSGGTRVGYNWFWQEGEDGRHTLWTRGQESFGANAAVYLFPGSDLIIIAATHSGPAETGEGPVTGWSRLVRDAMIDTFADSACDEGRPIFGMAEP